MSKNTVEIKLSDEAVELFEAYQTYTNTSPEQYIDALVEKTLPTLKALVEAFDEAKEPDAVMELFGQKMANEMLKQKQAQEAQQQTQQ